MTNAEQALDNLKKGGDIQKAQVFAMLAIAEAIKEVVIEIKYVAKEISRY